MGGTTAANTGVHDPSRRSRDPGHKPRQGDAGVVTRDAEIHDHWGGVTTAEIHSGMVDSRSSWIDAWR